MMMEVVKRQFFMGFWLRIFCHFWVITILFTHSDARKGMVVSNHISTPMKPNTKHLKILEVAKSLNMVMDISLKDSSTSLPPFDSLSPTPLPNPNNPPFCVYPPPSPTGSGSGPTPFGSGPTPTGSGPTPTGSGTTPTGSGPTPTGSGPTPFGSSPTPTGSGTTPTGSGPTPTGSGPTPFGSGPTPTGSGSGPYEPQLSPPPSPIGVEPNPPSIIGPPESVPSPFGFTPNPPYYEPGPPSGYIPSPPEYVPSPPVGFTPGPPVFEPPVVYPPPTVPPPRSGGGGGGGGGESRLWCVAKPTVPDPIIQEAMNYACASGADCGPLQPNGPCYEPNTLLAHASYAFNSYFQRTRVAGGSCDFGRTGMLVTIDPSSKNGCHFVNY